MAASKEELIDEVAAEVKGAVVGSAGSVVRLWGRMTGKRYNQDNVKKIKGIQKAYVKFINHKLPACLNITDDCIPKFAKNIDPQSSAQIWRSECSTHTDITNHIVLLFEEICHVQQVEMGKWFSVNVTAPENLFLHELKLWLVELSKMPTDVDTTLAVIKTRKKYIDAIVTNRVFHDQPWLRNLTHRINEIITQGCIATIHGNIMELSSRELLVQATKQNKNLVFYFAEFLLNAYRAFDTSASSIELIRNATDQNHSHSCYEQFFSALIRSPAISRVLFRELIADQEDRAETLTTDDNEWCILPSRSAQQLITYNPKEVVAWLINADGNSGLERTFLSEETLAPFVRSHFLLHDLCTLQIDYNNRLTNIAGFNGDNTSFGLLNQHITDLLDCYIKLLSLTQQMLSLFWRAMQQANLGRIEPSPSKHWQDHFDIRIMPMHANIIEHLNAHSSLNNAIKIKAAEFKDDWATLEYKIAGDIQRVVNDTPKIIQNIQSRYPEAEIHMDLKALEDERLKIHRYFNLPQSPQETYNDSTNALYEQDTQETPSPPQRITTPQSAPVVRTTTADTQRKSRGHSTTKKKLVYQSLASDGIGGQYLGSLQGSAASFGTLSTAESVESTGEFYEAFNVAWNQFNALSEKQKKRELHLLHCTINQLRDETQLLDRITTLDQEVADLKQQLIEEKQITQASQAKKETAHIYITNKKPTYEKLWLKGADDLKACASIVLRDYYMPSPNPFYTGPAKSEALGEVGLFVKCHKNRHFCPHAKQLNTRLFEQVYLLKIVSLDNDRGIDREKHQLINAEPETCRPFTFFLVHLNSDSSWYLVYQDDQNSVVARELGIDHMIDELDALVGNKTINEVEQLHDQLLPTILRLLECPVVYKIDNNCNALINFFEDMRSHYINRRKDDGIEGSFFDRLNFILAQLYQKRQEIYAPAVENESVETITSGDRTPEPSTPQRISPKP